MVRCKFSYQVPGADCAEKVVIVGFPPYMGLRYAIRYFKKRALPELDAFVRERYPEHRLNPSAVETSLAKIVMTAGA